jgi:arylsulfatase A-like enzyme
MASRRVVVPAALCAGLVGCGGCGGAEPERGAGYNVLLISLDSTRRDLVSAYGAVEPHAPGIPTSPNLDRLAAEGVLMRDAYATTSWTLPSHMTLLTGQPELVHAVEIDYLRPDPNRHTLPSVLAARGYATAGFYTGPYLDPRFGFAHGFERYEACFGPALTAATARMKDAEARRAAAEARRDAEAARGAYEEALAAEREIDDLSHRDVSSDMVVDRALDALERAHASGRPFFVFAHFFDPHYDYIAPAEHDRFDPGYDGPITGADFWIDPAIATFAATASGRARVVDDRGLEHVRALYAGEMHWTDAQVGRLLAKLDELGQAERTLVLVTSDHGDEFFEHDGLGHRRTLFEEVVRVPMILRMPGVLPAGAQVDGLVSNVDVFGTVLDLLGLPGVPGLRSSSMGPLIRGADDGARRAVFARLVANREGMFPAQAGGEPTPAQVFTITETYRVGRIKVERRSEWPERTGDVAPDLARKLDADAEQARNRELLRWIDVVAYPDEPEGAWSTDFSSGAPRAALAEFHDRYAELRRERRSARTADPDETPLAGMGGLGYAQSARATVMSERFVLPLPGAEILGKRR